MSKLQSLSFVVSLGAFSAFGCPPDAVAPIDSGYGAPGQYAVTVDTLRRSLFAWNRTYAYLPVGNSGPLPMIVFFHGMGSTEPSYYEHILQHLASRGYCVLFPAYRMASFPGQGRTYRRMFRGMVEGVRMLGSRVDTSRVGFAGHSFGAGAIPAFVLRTVTSLKWGAGGVFMFLMAPHFVFGITEEELRGFPSNVTLVVQVYQDDDCNDPRIGKHLFDTIGIGKTEKDFVTIRSDTSESLGCVLWAEHGVPFGEKYKWGRLNALDHFAVFRQLDALADYTFNGSRQGKRIALGSGGDDQRYMGYWKDGRPVREAVAGDVPQLVRPSHEFPFHWEHPWNPFHPTRNRCFLRRW
jgi:hypothetical protein